MPVYTDGVVGWPDVKKYRTGMYYPVWWETDKKINSFYKAKIMGIKKYVGRYPESFNYIFKLECGTTSSGWLEMVVKVKDAVVSKEY